MENIEEILPVLSERLSHLESKIGNIHLHNNNQNIYTRLEKVEQELQQIEQNNSEIADFSSDYQKSIIPLEDDKNSLSPSAKLEIITSAEDTFNHKFKILDKINNDQKYLDSPTFQKLIEAGGKNGELKPLKKITSEQSQAAALLQERLATLLQNYNQLTDVITNRFIEMNEKITAWEKVVDDHLKSKP